MSSKIALTLMATMFFLGFAVGLVFFHGCNERKLFESIKAIKILEQKNDSLKNELVLINKVIERNEKTIDSLKIENEKIENQYLRLVSGEKEIRDKLRNIKNNHKNYEIKDSVFIRNYFNGFFRD